MVPKAGIEPARISPGGFESPASPNFATTVYGAAEWSRTIFYGFSVHSFSVKLQRRGWNDGIRTHTCLIHSQTLCIKLHSTWSL